MVRTIFGLAALIAFIASSSCFVVYRDLTLVRAWVGLALVPLFAWLSRWRPAVDLEEVVRGQGGGQHVLTAQLRGWLRGEGAQQTELLYRDSSLRFALVAFLVGLAGWGWLLLVVAPTAGRAPIPFGLAALILSAVLWPSGRQLYHWLHAPLRPGIWLRDGHILVIASAEQFVCRDLAADLVTYSRAETRRDDRPVTNLHLLFREDGPHAPILLFSVTDAALARRLGRAIEEAQQRAAEAKVSAEQVATQAVEGAAPYREAKPPTQVATRDLLLRLWSAGPAVRGLPVAYGVVALALVLGGISWLAGLALSQQRALARCETIACHEDVLARAPLVLRRGQAENSLEALYRRALAAAQHDPPKLRKLALEPLSAALQGRRRRDLERVVREGSRQRLRVLYRQAREGLGKGGPRRAVLGPAALRSLLETAAAQDAHRLLLVVDSRLEAPDDPRQLGSAFGDQKTIPLALAFTLSARRQRDHQLVKVLQDVMDGVVGKGLLEVARSTAVLSRQPGNLARLLVDYQVQPTATIYHSRKRPWAAIGKPAHLVARYRSYYRGVRVLWRLRLQDGQRTLLALEGTATPSPHFSVRGPSLFGLGASAQTVYAGMLQSALVELGRRLRRSLGPSP